MKYLYVRWRHDHPNEPVHLYSELDENRHDKTKVEIFADGRRGYADRFEVCGGTRLAEKPCPTTAEIAADPQFEAKEISKEEFEKVWAARR